jgi:hypothetical protein
VLRFSVQQGEVEVEVGLCCRCCGVDDMAMAA